MPKCYKKYRADQCSHDGNAIHIDIADSCEDYNLGHQPDSYKGRDDRTDETEREPPTNNKLCSETYKRRNDQVNDKVEAERPDIISNVYRNAICQNTMLS